MAGIVAHRFLFGAPTSADRGVTAVPTWASAEAAITRILEEEERTGVREELTRGTAEERAP